MPSPGFVRSCRNTKKRDHGRPVVTMLEAGKAKGECHFYGCPLLSQNVYYDPLVKEELTQLRQLKQDEASDEGEEVVMITSESSEKKKTIWERSH
jgi:hypothetical protein